MYPLRTGTPESRVAAEHLWSPGQLSARGLPAIETKRASVRATFAGKPARRQRECALRVEPRRMDHFVAENLGTFFCAVGRIAAVECAAGIDGKVTAAIRGKNFTLDLAARAFAARRRLRHRFTFAVERRCETDLAQSSRRD